VPVRSVAKDRGVPMLSDAKIGLAMELHYGSGLCWKSVASRMGIDDVRWLRNQVTNAERFGMQPRRLESPPSEC